MGSIPQCGYPPKGGSLTCPEIWRPYLAPLDLGTLLGTLENPTFPEEYRKGAKGARGAKGVTPPPSGTHGTHGTHWLPCHQKRDSPGS